MQIRPFLSTLHIGRPSVMMRAMAAPVALLLLPLLRVRAYTPQECTEDCVPCSSADNRVINIAVLMKQDTAITALPVIYLAQQDLRKHGLRGPLEGWDVEIQYRDSECSSVTAPFEAVELHNAGAADVFIGPVCDYALAPICRFAKRWGTPVLSPAGKPQAFNDHPHFEMLIRLNGYYTELAKALRSVCQHWGWQKVGMLYEDSDASASGTLSDCHHQMSEVNRIMKQSNFSIEHFSFRRNTDLKLSLGQLSKTARIILFCAITRENVIKVMRTASQLGLTTSGEYVFFNVDLNAGFADDYKPWEGDDSSSVVNMQDFSAMFTITSRTPDSQDYRDFSDKVKKLTKELKDGELRDALNTVSNSSYRGYPAGLVTPYTASFYEGVMFYAEAFNRTLQRASEENKWMDEAKTPTDIGKKILKEMISGTFYSHLKKGNITLTNSTIPNDYAVLNLNVTAGQYREVSVYWGQLGKMNMNQQTVLWPGPNSTIVPKDMPKCGFLGELCPTEGRDLYWIIFVLSLLVLVLGVFSIIAIRKYRLEKQISSMSWKIPYSDIQICPKLQPTKGNFGSTLSIAKSITSMETLCNRQIFIKSGFYKGNRVAIKQLCDIRVNLTRPILLELKAMKELSSDHLVRMLGGCFENLNNCLITEYCSRGSLQDVLENDKLKLDDMIKYSLLHDIVKGLTRLHECEIKMHGNLKSTNCLVDSRFVLKITDFGILSLRHTEGEEVTTSAEVHQHYTRKLWSSPEMLRKGFDALSHDQIQRADIYSTGIIINEIFCRLGTFPLSDSNAYMTPYDIIEQVKEGGSPILRPGIECFDDIEVSDLMRRCWAEDPVHRPTLTVVKGVVRKKNKSVTFSIERLFVTLLDTHWLRNAE